ncbi:MAG: TrmH family RNA methyltransferase [Myxococcota bacterium]|nr:TrmH family RNA methyltransferase [Myxococcota bacterium]
MKPTDKGPSQRLTRADLRQRKQPRSRFETRERQPIAMVLDGVLGTYNQGAIFRLCDAFLIEQVHFCSTTIQVKHRRFLKSARGTQKWVPYTDGDNCLNLIRAYRQKGYQIVVAEQCTGSTPAIDAQFDSPVCLVLGGELAGVSQAVVDQADLVIEFPSDGMANSINVSMTAAMLVYAVHQAMNGP